MSNIHKEFHFRIICQSKGFILGHIYEDVYLVDKLADDSVFITSQYGDCSCGLISKDESWVLVCGETITIYRDNTIHRIENPKLEWVHDCRQINSNEVELLIDPWSENASIWKLTIDSNECNKASDFDKYKGKPYCNLVEW